MLSKPKDGRYCSNAQALNVYIDIIYATSFKSWKTVNSYKISNVLERSSVFIFLFFYFFTSTVHKTASLEMTRAILHIASPLWKLALRGHLNTDAQARDRTRKFLLTRSCALAVKASFS